MQDSAAFTAALQVEDLPNTTLYGVAFDGRRYLSACSSIAVDPEEMRLDVTVTPDREAYRPGDEVRVQVAVRDRTRAAGRRGGGQPEPGG